MVNPSGHVMPKLSIVVLFIGLAVSQLSAAKESTAELTVTNSTSVRIGGHYFKDPDDCSGGRTGFLPNNASLTPSQSATVTIDASEKFSMYLSTLDESDGIGESDIIILRSCLVPFTFTPKPGQKYLVQFSATQPEDSCEVQVEVLTDQGPREESSLVRRQWQTPWTESGSFCKPLH